MVSRRRWFAGIAFLWFIAVVRSSPGRPGDRFFDAIVMGSGLLFVSMLFAAAAADCPKDRKVDDMADEQPTGALTVSAIPKLGAWAWTFVGVIASLAILTAVLAAINEIMLPLTFAAVLAVVFKPAGTALVRRGAKPTVAAGVWWSWACSVW